MTTSFDSWADRRSTLAVADGEVALYDHGDGPAITFLHGFPSSSHDVAALLPHLRGYRVIAVDFPGFGASSKHPSQTYSIHGAADAVEAAWRHLHIPSTVVLAHDYGVSVAQELLARGSDAGADVRGVVWCNGGIYPDLHRPTAGQQLLLDPQHGPAVSASMTVELFGEGIRGTWGRRNDPDESAITTMWESVAHNGGTTELHRLLHYVADRRRHSARWVGALETTDLPMVFLWGDLDPVSGAHVADRLAVRLPGQTLTRLADVGHWPPLEAPVEVADAVRHLADMRLVRNT